MGPGEPPSRAGSQVSQGHHSLNLPQLETRVSVLREALEARERRVAEMQVVEVLVHPAQEVMVSMEAALREFIFRASMVAAGQDQEDMERVGWTPLP